MSSPLNLEFIQAVCASKVAELGSQEVFSEQGVSSSFDQNLLKAYQISIDQDNMPETRDYIDSFSMYTSELFSTIDSQVSEYEKQIVLAELRAYEFDINLAVDASALQGAFVSTELDDASSVLQASASVQDQFVTAYKNAQNNFGNPNLNALTDAAQETVGVLSTLGASENIEKFKAIAHLYQLQNTPIESNYALVLHNFESILDNTYSQALRGELIKMFNYTWRSGSFMNLGVRYETDTWHTLCEYCYKNSPGYLADAHQYYLTVGYRYGQFNPHLTFATHHTNQKILSNYALNLRNPDHTLLDNWKNMFDHVLDGGTVSNPVVYENMLFILDQLQDYWLLDQAHDQYSWTMGVRYDLPHGLCLKADYQYITPKKGQRGFFDTWDLNRKVSAQMVSFSVDAVF